MMLRPRQSALFGKVMCEGPAQLQGCGMDPGEVWSAMSSKLGNLTPGWQCYLGQGSQPPGLIPLSCKTKWLDRILSKFASYAQILWLFKTPV